MDESYRSDIEALASLGFADARSGECGYLLERTSYAHLAYYFRVVLASSRAAGTAPTVKAVHDVMTLDRRFQSVMMKYVGLVESQARAQYAHWMQAEHGDFPHYDGCLFLNPRNYEGAMRRYAREADRAKRNNRIMRESADQNGGKLPISLAVQAMSFGVLSRFYSNTASTAVTHSVADSFGAKRDELSNWLRAIADTRNVFAHFGAYLTRAQMPTTPRKIIGLDAPNNEPPYIMYLIAHLLSEPQGFNDLGLEYTRSMRADLTATFDGFGRLYGHMMPWLRISADWKALLEDAISS